MVATAGPRQPAVALGSTCAEVYRVDAASVEEAKALDEANDPPEDILQIHRECGTFIVPGSHSAIWLVPDPS